MKTENDTMQSTTGNKQTNETKKSINLPLLKTNSTVLTNLQRGNTKTQQNTSHLRERTLFELAAQGDIGVQSIKNYLNELDQQDSNGFTALTWSSYYGQLSTCKLLINHGIDVSHKGNHGETALHFAAAYGHIHILKLLIYHGADVNDTDEDGNTALIYSCFKNHELCVQELLNAKADWTIQNINNDTAYTLAVKNKSNQSKILLEKHILKYVS